MKFYIKIQNCLVCIQKGQHKCKVHITELAKTQIWSLMDSVITVAPLHHLFRRFCWMCVAGSFRNKLCHHKQKFIQLKQECEKFANKTSPVM